MTSNFVHVVALFMVVSFASRPAPCRPSPPAGCPRGHSPPALARAAVQLSRRRVVAAAGRALLAKSETFRRQWDAINASPLIRVRVRSIIGCCDESRARARDQVSRYAYGSDARHHRDPQRRRHDRAAAARARARHRTARRTGSAGAGEAAANRACSRSARGIYETDAGARRRARTRCGRSTATSIPRCPRRARLQRAFNGPVPRTSRGRHGARAGAAPRRRAAGGSGAIHLHKRK